MTMKNLLLNKLVANVCKYFLLIVDKEQLFCSCLINFYLTAFNNFFIQIKELVYILC